MHSNSRHTIVSVVATIAMVVMTVLLATWFPAPTPDSTPGAAAVVMQQNR